MRELKRILHFLCYPHLYELRLEDIPEFGPVWKPIEKVVGDFKRYAAFLKVKDVDSLLELEYIPNNSIRLIE